MRRPWGLAALAAAFALSLVFYYSAAEANSPPPIPHGIAGMEKCLTCHNTQGPLPVPTDHAAFDESTCLSCHSYSSGSLQQEGCLTCHGQSGLNMTLPGGEVLPLFVDPNVFADSVHGSKLLCTDCHSSITGYPHPKIEITSRRLYSIAKYELCKKCHFDNYTKTLDSIHYAVLSSGDLSAPLCTDCHGAHNVAPPSQPRSKISQTCSQCHQGLYEQYAGSVHGKALIEENNFDVPVCTDCHRSHTIEDPRTAAFRIESVKLCSGCHSNEKLMQKYGISTQVVQTYLQDFHGASVALIGEQGKDIWAKEAVCTDCHGVHDIERVDSPDSPVIKANLLNTCRKCHPDATTNFPGAWLAHYQPSLNKAPLVYLVRQFYWVLIPFIILGLAAHILVDLWRVITNR